MADTAHNRKPEAAHEHEGKKRRETPRWPTLPPLRRKPEEVASNIEALVKESIEHEPFEMKAEEALEPGEKVLKNIMGSGIRKTFVIESGTSRKQPYIHTEFMHTPVHAATFPGLERPSGLYPENKDGVVIVPDDESNTLSIVLADSDGYEPEDAALANAAATSASYDLLLGAGKITGLSDIENLERIFRHADTTVTKVREEFGNASQKVEMVGAVLAPDYSKTGYRLNVANNGKSHCLIIDQHTGKFESIGPGMPKPGSEKAVESPTALKQFLAGPGEIVVLATDTTVEACGGEEKLAEYFVKRSKEGLSAGKICRTLINEIENRQKDGEIEDSSASMVVYAVPEFMDVSVLR